MKAIIVLPAALLMSACSSTGDAGQSAADAPASPSVPVRVFGQQLPTIIGSVPPGLRGAPTESWEVRMQRGACFGICPAYELAIHDAGSVDFIGHDHVAAAGPRQGTADPTALAQLRQRLQDPSFAGLVGVYRHGAPACGPWATDMPTVTVDVWQQGHWQHIEHDLGCSAAPMALRSLEEAIDTAAQSQRWTGGRVSE